VAHWTAIGLLALAPQLAAAQASVSSRVDRTLDSAVRAVAVAGDYRLYRDPEWTVSATGALEQSRDEPGQALLGATSIAQGLKALYGFQLAQRAATLSLSYGLRRDWLGDSGLDTGQSGSIDLGWQLTPAAGIGLFGTLRRMNFDQDGVAARLDSQDGAAHQAGIRGMLVFDYRRQTLQGSLSYVENDAEGANFVSRGAVATLQYTHLLARRWSLVAGADYARTRYTEFAADPARASELQGCRFALQGPLLRRLTASLAYALNVQTWNQDPLVKQESVLLSLSHPL